MTFIRRLILAIVCLLAFTSACQSLPSTSAPQATASAATLAPQLSVSRANLINDMAFDQQGALWVATYDGIVQWNLETGSYIRYAEGSGLVDDYFISAIAIAPDGSVWAGGGARPGAYHLYRFNGQIWTIVNTGIDDQDFRINSIVTVPDGTLWLSQRHGALSFDGKTWTNHPDLPEFGTMAVGPDGTLWAGAICKALFEYDGKTWVTHLLPHRKDCVFELGYLGIKALAVSPAGSIWVGSNDGISEFRSGASYTTRAGLVNDHVRAAAVATDGTLWVGTESGVSQFDGTRWMTYTTEHGLVSNNVRSIRAAPHRVLCLGTDKGVSCFDGQDWINYLVREPV